MSAIRLTAALPVLVLLAACQPATEAPQPAPRPVLSMLVEPAATAEASFVGVVSPRISVTQAFRVGGTLINRSAGVGDQVRAGAALADLDATTLDLAVETARANLQAAEAQYANAAGAEGRLRALTESDVTTVANLEQAEQQSAAALAGVVQARSRLTQATEQRSYASLAAPFDGVVTAVGAEPGAVVAAGQTVLTIARTDSRDVVIDVPESFVQNLEVGAVFRVSPQLSPATVVDGTLREIAPEADPVTRSWRLKIGVDDAPAQFWLGTTATASLAVASTDTVIRVPETAIRHNAEATSVWVVDPAANIVNARPVELGAVADGQVDIRSGLAAGERIAIAGVNSLVEGQPVAEAGELQ
ncbi:efflux RND transporter periplasmic adaptor subunit [Devosia sp. LjRoot16]|uniref:efflux RND transporter periplasmic adaptor subunit n=1 Tax=Devosia sp. LjRoot16 TaxID=3342271 RepID=UPI003ECFC5A7